MNTVCGTVQGIFDAEIQVSVNRKLSCQGCESSGICHGFTKTKMDIRLPKPPSPVTVGDTVIIAMEGSSVVRASAYAFLIPLIAIIASLSITHMMSSGVATQVIWALLAFVASLIIVRHMGKRIESPHIIEVIHEE